MIMKFTYLCNVYFSFKTSYTLIRRRNNDNNVTMNVQKISKKLTRAKWVRKV